jgi:hypothetical protein
MGVECFDQVFCVHMVGGEMDYFVEVNGMVIAEQGTSVSVSVVLMVL